MESKTDPLFDLTLIATGTISVSINPHRLEESSAQRYIEDRGLFLTEGVDEGGEASKGDTLVVVTVFPHRTIRRSVLFWGYELTKVIQAACKDVRKYQALPPPHARKDGINLTEALESLGVTCRSGVELCINPQREFRSLAGLTHCRPSEMVGRYLHALEAGQPDIFEPFEDGSYNISPALRQAMVELDRILHVRYYPNSYVGSFDNFDTDLASLLEEAIGTAEGALVDPDVLEAERLVNSQLNGQV